jgi:hypothetical protein
MSYPHYPGDCRWDELSEEAGAWADLNFPQATHASKAEHLRREAAELAANPTDEEEMADVLLLLIHLARGTNTNLINVAYQKLRKNQNRSWGKPDEHGVVEHIRS